MVQVPTLEAFLNKLHWDTVVQAHTLKRFCTSCTGALPLVDPVLSSVLLKKSSPILLAKRLLMLSFAALADSYATKEKMSKGWYRCCAAKHC